jgi:hypothetical protein
MRVFENTVLRKVFCARRKVTGKDCMTSSITIFNFNKYSGDQITNIGMGEACGAERGFRGIGGETDHLENQGVDGRKILKKK